ncbi:MAG: histidine--tRNA ligase [Alphaproteobacteria bacterium]|nr:histidine--tRNA ligase [Alphaproteobacteria bacterium]
MSKEKQKTYKPKPVSGFPEWLPEERLVEQKWLDHIRRTFESYGFCSIETPSVEEIDVLLAKGEVDKEIYVLERLHKDEDEEKEARLALHFDQTVPFARYTAQHFNELVFPFKRYQMQRVWRGERPQMGRMREFTQCDIDVINVDNLPLAFDAEIPAMIYETLAGLNIGRVQLRISNRKILLGYLSVLGINKTTSILSAIDKLEKVGKEQTELQIGLEIGLDKVGNRTEIVENILQLVTIKASPKEFSGLLRDFIARNDVIARSDSDAAIQIFNEGIEELSYVLDNLSHLPEGSVVADLSIVRGLDYYTGTVYETQLLDVPEFTGSVCSGGRYDDLASQYINKKLPGVGISIGFSRLFDVIRQSRPDLMNIGPKSPAHILMYTEDENLGSTVNKTAQVLRKRGINVEVYHTVKKWDKHFKYAEKKMIPYIWYVRGENDHAVKAMSTGEQVKADPQSWSKE